MRTWPDGRYRAFWSVLDEAGEVSEERLTATWVIRDGAVGHVAGERGLDLIPGHVDSDEVFFGLERLRRATPYVRLESEPLNEDII